MMKRIATVTLLGICVGCCVALLAVLFVDAVAWLNDTLFISPRSRMLVGDEPWLILVTLAVPTLGGLTVGLLCRAIPEQRPHGPPDAILGAHSIDGRLPVKGGIITAIAACLSLGTGASVGQYGPLTHMGASLGSWFSRLFGSGRYLGIIGIGCGTAAAIATAFNAPIAGLVFAHEVVLRHYSLRAFAPITVAASMGYVLANVVFDRPPLFRIEAVEIGSLYEFPVFIALGIVGAVIATVLMHTVLLASRVAQSLILPGPIKTALAGLAVGVVALQLPEVLGVGKEILRFAIIEDAFTASELGILLVAKLLLTAACLGFGFAGGVFSPALLIGILFGALAGTGAQWVFGDDRSHIAIYAVCGMVAVTSPVIGAPLTSILIVFELTRNYDLAIAAMVSVAFANLVGYRIFGRSLFDVQLRQRGFDLRLGRDKVIVEQRQIREFVSNDYTVTSAHAGLDQVLRKLLEQNRHEAYIVDSANHYIGTISMNQLVALSMADRPMTPTAGEFAKPEPLILSPDNSIWEAMAKLENFVGESIPVVENQTLVGVVFEASIVRAYLHTLDQIRHEEHAAV